MRSYHETEHLDPVAVAAFRKAQRIVEAIPDPAHGEEPYRCHEVVRVVGEILGLPVVDGMCGTVDHSWLVVPSTSRHSRGAILDPYVPGGLPQVAIFDCYEFLPWKDAYRPREPRDDIDHELVMSLKAAVLSRIGEAVAVS